MDLLLTFLQMTEQQALHMWHHYNGDYDNDTDDDGDFLNSSVSSTEFNACQSDLDEEPQPDPYQPL